MSICQLLVHDAKIKLDVSGVLPGTVQLLYADPPFNLGVDYLMYSDRLSTSEYEEFSKRWVTVNSSLVRDGGWFVVCSPPELSGVYESALKNSGFDFYDRVIWHRTFGNQSQNGHRLSRAHTELLIYGRGLAQAHWDRVRVPSARLSIYGDKRADPSGKIPGTVWVIPDNPESSVWTVSMVCGTFKERVGWCKCQQPIKLVARVISALTDPEDLVIDPFSGAGTTALTCRILGRNCVSWDIDPAYIENGQKRVNQITDSQLETLREQLRLSGTIPSVVTQVPV
jgi:DNA modification methylase